MPANRPEAADRWERLVEVHRQLALLVEELDRIELHHAAAHASTALDIMRREHPQLLATS